jgi:hypothetical protein
MTLNATRYVSALLAIAILSIPRALIAGDGTSGLSTAVQPVVTYDGWTGTGYAMACTDHQCTEPSGCSWLFHQYDWYYPQYRCAGSGNQEDTCTQTMMLCRETKTYTGSEYGACTGSVTQWSKNYYGACASG